MSDEKTKRRAGEPAYGILNLEDLPPGHLIDDRYEIKEKLGQGGFGAVYLAYDKNMEVDKALKVLPAAIAEDKEAMLDFQREARTMISLEHPNIVRVYDFHDIGRIKYIDMAYIEGKTLSKIKLEYPDKCVPEEQVRELALQIAEGLAYAHSQGVIHKDIKPQNIKVTEGGQVKIMDFGIAEKLQSSMSRVAQTSSSGTLVYMSPEQLDGENVGKEADIYSFGAVLYELLSGHPPFYRGDIHHQIRNRRPEEIKSVSSEINQFLQKCLQKKYQDRFSTIEEVRQNLSDLSSISGTVPPILARSGESLIVRTFKGHSSDVNSLSFSPDSRYVISGSCDNTLKLWEVTTGREIRTFKGHSRDVNSVSFSPDGRYALSGSSDRTLKLWEVATGREVRTFEGHSGHISSVDLTSDGSYALSGGWDDRTLKLWEVATGREVRTFEGHSSWVFSANLSPDDQYALSGSYDKTIKLWDVATGSEIRTFEGHSKEVKSAVFSPDGHYALSGSIDGTLRLWEVATGREIRTFEGHSNEVYASFSPDGRYVLSGSWDSTLKLWDVATGRAIWTFEGNIYGIKSVAFSPDARYALSGGNECTFKLWNLSPWTKSN